ncbi:MAG: tRNA (adenosine(37)-N6)-threonylcarbamoyltransferase complex dimerization subunit type 1 TsaB [Chloroflexi bacterium]|nr:tRNA (adenosine(37)-N6)-threonylcarbamoyltransferase complex dimerization subunit type 1 TsaB [Chloroflexota bacterium]MCI0808145.1 tRNA (adenosine(37)-N6)-threonylcarbamoyltransferase complex dimerization subunit type 1 TsaB [Chloroflexota bacterium]MCI0834541.1 tRNA (adenosine(37)-N6)-threonylcarbamoyltransferase complex dimerization subunit type 1 TsaB [Chloroflexota bacterium]MCI0874042.1 tRNA (adenosine(37)-N6)-threonylcarbamoyltransferase complex dimerization subunit type 1 TsaB [Chloro
MILAVIDTSTQFAGVGVVDDAGKRVTRAWRSDRNHGRELMPALVESLAELSLAPTDITHVAVALGPGGFSAVRVGISTTLGLIVAKKLPVLGVPTHDIEVGPFRDLVVSGIPVYSLIPAGRQELSWMRHSETPDDVGPDAQTGVSSPQDFLDRLEPGALLCGEACDLMVGLVEDSRFPNFGTPKFAEHGPGAQRDPNSLLDIATEKFGAGASTAYEELRPIYARPPSISRPKPAR